MNAHGFFGGDWIPGFQGLPVWRVSLIALAIMTTRQACAAVALALLPGIALSGEKVRNWQVGKVIDTERSRYFAGTVGSGSTTGTAQTNGNYGTYQGQTNTTQTAVYRVYQTIAIEGDSHAYMAQERLRWKWSKPANLTVNAPVKFAVAKRKLFVIDDDGREHEMEIIKQVLKQPANEPKNP